MGTRPTLGIDATSRIDGESVNPGPVTDNQLPSYLTNLWDAIASRPVLINDVDSFWKSYQDQWQRIIQSFSSIAFTYRVRPLALAIIKGLFSNSPSRKNCLDVVPKETGIQEVSRLNCFHS
jgi:hypothetical protein